ncbi:LuxR C-terminal-related transcriptional regulator [Phytohabitans suffuscus]|nr:AAA family ATPase [Phytohabitans suffuscus]
MDGSLRIDDPVILLDRTLQNAFEGRGGVAVIGGGIAMGKTMLLHAFCDRAAARGALVLDATVSAEEENLAFGVMHQLLQHAPDAIRRQADIWMPRLGTPDEAEQRTPDASLDTAYALGAALVALAGDRPVVIAVDDVQYLDGASLQCLVVVARRVRSARVVLVATNCQCPQPSCRRFLTRVGRLSTVQHVLLEPLTETEVENALRRRLAVPVTAQVARACHRITGGNPLLVEAFAQDLAGGDGESLEVRPGPRFRDAVLTLADRYPRDSLAVLQATALMGDLSSATRIATLVDPDPGAVAWNLRVLEEGGLLHEGRCRHPAVAAAIADSMTVEQRLAAHQRLAELLHEDHASALAVARHLIAADLPRLPWATETLRAAAEEQAREDPEAAAQFIKAARRLSRDGAEQASLTLALAALAWRTDPAAVRRYLPEIVHLHRERQLGHRDTESTLRYLLWFGRMDDAADLLRRTLEAISPEDVATATEWRTFVLWLSFWYPGVVRRVPEAGRLRRDPSLPGEATVTWSSDVACVFEAMLGDGQPHDLVPEALRLLEACRPSSMNHDFVFTVLVGLVAADQLQSAWQWCETLIEQARDSGDRLWRARLAALLGDIACRSGDVAAAATYAGASLAQVGASGWGTTVGLPLSTLVRVELARGNAERAAEILTRPVPRAMHETTYGMMYGQVRGQLLLAKGTLPQARAEFQASWNFMARHGVEAPNLLPWRLHLAEVLAALGETPAARLLAEEQLSLVATGGHWARGRTLRLLGGMSGPAEAQQLLTESIKELHTAGARLELALTLAEAAQCCQALGDSVRAGRAIRRAQLIAMSCGVMLRPRPALESGSSPAPGTEERPGISALTAAEQRVAVLAVKGLTNTQIAGDLFLTVSTVEQHLTHIYRKLKVRGRAQLVAVADLSAVSGAGPE